MNILQLWQGAAGVQQGVTEYGHELPSVVTVFFCVVILENSTHATASWML